MRSKNKRRPTPLQICKFSGASLADAAAIDRAAALIASHDGPLVVVASALAGITDHLLGGAQEAAAGTVDAGAARGATFLQRYRQAVNALAPSGTTRRRLLARVEEAAKQYRDVAGVVAVLGRLE